MLKFRIILLFAIAVVFVNPAFSQPPDGYIDVREIERDYIDQKYMIDKLYPVFTTWNGEMPVTNCDRTANGDCDSWTEWTVRNVVVGNIMGFDNCLINVTYQYRRCIFSNLFQQNIISWSANWIDAGEFGTNCNEFKDKMNSLSGVEKSNFMYEFEKAINEKISRAMFIYENEAHYKNTNSNILCDDNGDPKALLPFKVFYTKGSCSYYLTLRCRSAVYENVEWTWTFNMNCSPDYCCKHFNSYCYDKEGNLISKSVATSDSEECSNAYPSYEEISKFLIWYEVRGIKIIDFSTTPCSPSCSDYIPHSQWEN